LNFLEKKLLIDSNSYFRLAQSLHPLLNSTFGKDYYCIYILKECDQEYNENQALQNKFSWVNQNYLNVSEVDIKYLATALELDLILITDDGDMIAIAKEFEIKVIKSLELLKLMFDCSCISIDMIKEITQYWLYSKDTPKNFREDCLTLFSIKY